ncbi:MAG TPA: FKBP-type peptidyl-prolyl cis-trans isomerase [Dermatophilaceae bacterium]|nr:FKBP-type peptidyl-prolyl cis-trans isomerase [Dermatophilaceae bacterium]
MPVPAASFRHRTAVLTGALVLVVAAGCGSDGAATPPAGTASVTATSSATVSPELDKVTATVEPGKSAKIVLPATPFTATKGYRVLTPGSGSTISGDQIVTVDLLVVSGKDGKELESSYGKKPAQLSLSEPSLLADIKAALIGQQVGAQVLIASQVSAAGQGETSVSANDTVVFLFQVLAARTPLKRAEGTAVPPKPGLPAVTMGATEKDPATFVLPSPTPPTTTVAQPLIVGSGPKVVAGQRIRVSYTGVTWREPGKPFDYSGQQPGGYAEFDVGQGQLIKAWDKSLVGQTVGSRLLLIVPPADGYGSKGSGPIKGTDTLVFVLDILDAR